MQHALIDRFDKLRQRTHKSTYMYLLSLVRNREDAEDLTQDTYLRAFRVCDRLQDITAAEPWLRRIAFTSFLDFMRRKKRRIQAAPFFDREGEEWEPADPGPAPDAVLLGGFVGGPLAMALNGLEESERDLVLVSASTDVSKAELAVAIGTGTSQILTRLHKAHRRMRISLGAEDTRE